MVLFSVSAFSEVPTYFAKDVTCEQLKLDIDNYGSVNIRQRGIFGNVWSAPVFKTIKCGFRETKMSGVFRTSDMKRCVAGVYCIRDLSHDRPNCGPGGNGCLQTVR